jgi:hypothetical protein
MEMNASFHCKLNSLPPQHLIDVSHSGFSPHLNALCSLLVFVHSDEDASDNRIVCCSFVLHRAHNPHTTLAVPALLLAMLFAATNVVAQVPAECLYNDAHFHIQDFKADGPHIADILKMITVAKK